MDPETLDLIMTGLRDAEIPARLLQVSNQARYTTFMVPLKSLRFWKSTV